MAIIKCKMCGGDLEILEDSTVCECAYCGTRQTVPSADNEKKLTLFARAGRFLRECEFDKAAGVYESIIADFDQEAEAYWGLILCRYGIEYVDDPATGKKVPTCHRSSFESVMDDADFERVMDFADPIARRVYRDDAAFEVEQPQHLRDRGDFVRLLVRLDLAEDDALGVRPGVHDERGLPAPFPAAFQRLAVDRHVPALRLVAQHRRDVAEARGENAVVHDGERVPERVVAGHPVRERATSMAS